MIDNQIGQYQIIDVIGQGGMATVYKAYQPSFDRYVAIKVMPRQLLEDPTFLKRFQREARTIARLEHRSILPVYDYGEQDGVPYIVMRLVEEGTLRKKMFYEEIDLPTAAQIIEQVAEALDYAHLHGVVHRDLKPSNILLDENNNAYLTDFGIAKMLGSTSQVTGSGVVGTPSYMSPEQCQGKPVTPASDIYALGSILYEVVTGKAPFDADTPLAVMYMHVKDLVPSVRLTKPGLPADLDLVIDRAMAKRVEDRYRTAKSMAEDFKRVVQGQKPVGVEAREYVVTQQVTPAEPVPPPADLPVTVVEHTPGTPPPPIRPAVMPPAQPARRRGISRGVLVAVAGVMGIAVLLAVVGFGLIALSWLNSGGGAIAPPPLPTPTRTAAPPVDVISGDESSDAVATKQAAEGTTQSPTEGTAELIEPTSPPTDEPTPAPPPTTLPTPTIPPPTDVPVASGRIVFIQGFRSAAEIVVMDADGSGRRVLTSNSVYDGEPDWSPDGTLIAFESERGASRDIYIMNADGSNVRQLTSDSGEERNPDWSPDGQLIVYEARSTSADEASSELYVIQVSSGAITRLTSNDYGDRAPKFSPDGTRITFMTMAHGKWQVALMEYPSGNSLGVYECPEQAPACRFPSWSPDGAQIAFNTLDSSNVEDKIWILDLGSGRFSVLVQEQDNGRPVWSGDGQYLYFNRAISSDNSDIYRLNLTTGAVERLTTGSIADYAPDWGPG